eukprot:3429159-Pleurochrysis_carterae.AAC.1
MQLRAFDETSLLTLKCAVPSDVYGCRLQPLAEDDTFGVQWSGAFDSAGLITNSVVGSWQPRCVHLDRRGRPHAWKEMSTAFV